MKKLLALILAITFILSLTACGKNDKPEPIADKSNVTVSDVTSTESESESNEVTENENTVNTPSSEISFEDVKSFDDFTQKMDESGLKPTLTQNNDGTITVSLETPTNDDKTAKPAIPTIDTVPKPIKPEEIVNPETKPEENKKEETKTEEKTETSEEEKTQVETKPTTENEPVVPEKVVEKKPAYSYTTNQKHTKVPYTERYLYSVLDEEKKGWYRAIDDAVTNLKPRANIKANLAENNNYYIYYLYMFDNPEHFYLGNEVMIYSYGDKDKALLLCYSDGEMTCRAGGKLKEINDELRARIKAKKAVFEAEVNSILSTIPANAPDVWKEKLIYDRILIDSHYNLSAEWDGIAEDNWTAYGIIVNKMGVCESYSEAFQTLCLYAGINCTGVVGTAGGGHKWNCVKLDGEWYMCDITFDDPIGGEQGVAYHYYFNLTSAEMKELYHNWSNSRWPVPNCTATKYSYTNYFGN